MEERERGENPEVPISADNTLRLPERREGIVPYRIVDGTYQFIRFTGSRPLWTDERIMEVVRDLFYLRGNELVKEIVTRFDIEMVFKSETEAKRYVAINREEKKAPEKFYKGPLGLGDPTLTRHKVPRVIKTSSIKRTVRVRNMYTEEEEEEEKRKEEEEKKRKEEEEKKRRRNIQMIPSIERFSGPLLVGQSYTVLDLINKLVGPDPATYLRIEGIEFLRRAYRQEVGELAQGSREGRTEGIPSILGTYVGIHSLPVLEVSGFETKEEEEEEEESHREEAKDMGTREIFPSIFGTRDITNAPFLSMDVGGNTVVLEPSVTGGVIGSEYVSEPRFISPDHGNNGGAIMHPHRSERGSEDVIAMDTTSESNAFELSQRDQSLLDLPSEMAIRREDEGASDTSAPDIAPSSQEWGLPSDPDTDSQDL